VSVVPHGRGVAHDLAVGEAHEAVAGHGEGGVLGAVALERLPREVRLTAVGEHAAMQAVQQPSAHAMGNRPTPEAGVEQLLVAHDAMLAGREAGDDDVRSGLVDLSCHQMNKSPEGQGSPPQWRALRRRGDRGRWGRVELLVCGVNGSTGRAWDLGRRPAPVGLFTCGVNVSTADAGRVDRRHGSQSTLPYVRRPRPTNALSKLQPMTAAAAS